MQYKEALEKAWKDISDLAGGDNRSVRFLGEEYVVDIAKRDIRTSTAGSPAKDRVSIIILHYLTQRLKSKTMLQPKGEWVDFKNLTGGEGYYPAFKKRTIDVILKKYGKEPDKITETAERFDCKPASIGDIGLVINAFEDVPILITVWKGDEEFEPEANMLFDETISGIFCTEDIVVLAEIITHSL